MSNFASQEISYRAEPVGRSTPTYVTSAFRLAFQCGALIHVCPTMAGTSTIIATVSLDLFFATCTKNSSTLQAIPTVIHYIIFERIPSYGPLI
jgi:hypothetical protein